MHPHRAKTALTAVMGYFALATAIGAQSIVVNIPATDLKDALDELIRITNVQLVYRVDDIRGIQSHTVQGTYTFDQALAHLLQDTGVVMHQSPEGAIAIFRVPPISIAPLKKDLASNVSTPVQETITITGYRDSLNRSIALKQAALMVRDSIVAEDIGKYPANNIAESLARVPGVVIARDTRTDEGKSIILRGLDADYTIVTLNGNPIRMVTGTSVGNNNRSVDLDALGPDIFNRVDLYKTPSVLLDEGGVGGVIDMRTPHPFDYDGQRGRYAIGYSFNSYRRRALPRFNFQISDHWGRFGTLFAFVFSENSYQVMGSEAAGWGQSRNSNDADTIGTSFDFGPENGGYDARANLGTYSIAAIEHAYIPRFFSREHLELDDRTRYSGLLSLQYLAQDIIDIRFDFLAAELRDRRSEYTLGAVLRGSKTTEAGWSACQAGTITIGMVGCSGVVPIDVHVDSNNNLYGTFRNVSWINESRWYDGYTRYANATSQIQYTPIEQITLTAITSIGDSHSFYSDNRIIFYMYNTTVTYAPVVNSKLPSVWTDNDMTDVAGYSNPLVNGSYSKEGDRVITAKLSASYHANDFGRWLQQVSIDFGAGLVTSKKTNDRKTSSSLANQIAINGTSFADLTIFSYTTDHIPVDNFLTGLPHGHRVTQWVTVPRSFYNDLKINHILALEPSERSGLYDVTEQVASFYAQFAGERPLGQGILQLAIGVRVAWTRLWGLNYITSQNDSDEIEYTRNPLHNNYRNILPAISLIYKITDEIILRSSCGDTLTRPSVGTIAQGTTISDRFTAIATSGNAHLKPFTSRNIDLSAEWYFSPQSLISIGLFYKGVKNLVSTQTETVTFSSLNLPWSSLDQSVFGITENPDLPIKISHPVNLNPMIIRGGEIFYQQSFDFLPHPFNKFGALLSLTYTTGAMGGTGTGFSANNGTVYKMQMTGMSAYTYSTTGYYESSSIGLRLTYSWHAKSPGSDNNYYDTDLRLWNQARGSLDATIDYTFSNLLSLRLDATNILNQSEYAYLADGTKGHALAGQGSSRINYAYWHGATFTLTLRGKL